MDVNYWRNVVNLSARNSVNFLTVSIIIVLLLKFSEYLRITIPRYKYMAFPDKPDKLQTPQEELANSISHGIGLAGAIVAALFFKTACAAERVSHVRFQSTPVQAFRS